MILACLVHRFDLQGLEANSQNWIERQKIFFLWERLPLEVRISLAQVDKDESSLQ